MGLNRCTRPMGEARNLPGRASTPGKRISPWKERLVLIACIAGAFQVGDEVVAAIEPHFGWWANPIAFIGLTIASFALANQLVLFIEKLQGIR